MENHFISTIPAGSIIHSSRQKSETVKGLPEDVQKQWEKGSGLFLLKKSGADLLSDYSREELEAIIEARKPLNLEAESILLTSALKSKSKPKKATEKE